MDSLYIQVKIDHPIAFKELPVGSMFLLYPESTTILTKTDPEGYILPTRPGRLPWSDLDRLICPLSVVPRSIYRTPQT